jgi:hypothetical protein
MLPTCCRLTSRSLRLDRITTLDPTLLKRPWPRRSRVPHRALTINLQQTGGLTEGPAADGDPDAIIYNNQFHVLYRDGNGTIWDSWYTGPGGQWTIQQINLDGLTSGPATVGDPTAFIYNNQSHVPYLDASGNVWDSWYDGTSWNLQQINLGGVTSGPAAVGDAASVIYNNQSHVLYRDGAGKVWDSWYDGSA